jgi:hypothetical protein
MPTAPEGFRDASRAYKAAVDALMACKAEFGGDVALTEPERQRLARLKGAVRAAKARMDEAWQGWEAHRMETPGASSRSPEGRAGERGPHRERKPEPAHFEPHATLTARLLGDPPPGRTPWS